MRSSSLLLGEIRSRLLLFWVMNPSLPVQGSAALTLREFPMKRAHTAEIDFMSNLPEELLLYIMRLSSLKARAAVQTCILSKRWMHLWEFLPDLDFDLREFNNGDPEQDQQRFSCFVTTMLERRKTHILHKFRLSSGNLCKNQHGLSIRKWVAYAIQHQVRMLELAVCLCDADTVLTDYVFACDSIEELHLHLSQCHPGGCLFGTEKINLPRVRKLQLNSQCITHADFISYLISGCPLLEELWLESFDLPFDSTISSQKLKHLTLKNCRFITELTIIAPNLVSFCFFGSIIGLQRLINQCGSLLSLTISAVGSLAGIYDIDIFPSKNVLSRLESLEFCVPKNEPTPESPSFYTVYNLKKLSICGHSFDRFPCIWKYLPNLEKLTVWSSCQHSKEQYSESLKWDDVLRRALIECKRLKIVGVVFTVYDDRKRKLLEDLRQLRDVEIVISDRGF
ncbi:hypothetical protein LUZ62_048230 [Rhynchospora pubera]|uniref:F-box/LRR-repeat protein 15/At3g58940/PEG3-like LRR domain-containing protein n=1 Tax=Rhynchospora pubera TaxID=906938 RepID=A0AAV8FTZ2_9POAL|nr:hypothetical protein LUZ62_048230 [Rhynchospora pubera]